MLWPETMSNYKTPEERKLEEQNRFEQKVNQEVERKLKQELFNQSLLNQIKE